MDFVLSSHLIKVKWESLRVNPCDEEVYSSGTIGRMMNTPQLCGDTYQQ